MKTAGEVALTVNKVVEPQKYPLSQWEVGISSDGTGLMVAFEKSE